MARPKKTQPAQIGADADIIRRQGLARLMGTRFGAPVYDALPDLPGPSHPGTVVILEPRGVRIALRTGNRFLPYGHRTDDPPVIAELRAANVSLKDL